MLVSGHCCVLTDEEHPLCWELSCGGPEPCPPLLGCLKEHRLDTGSLGFPREAARVSHLYLEHNRASTVSSLSREVSAGSHGATLQTESLGFPGQFGGLGDGSFFWSELSLASDG